ncbi:MAG: ATP-binding protein [Schwartzia sp.]|nr:ATP-binding protein [Schwartzia sp. (in: firmicutes)]
MIQRNEYLRRLSRAKDTRIIKIITGVRRCGKSTLLVQFQEELRASGIPDEQILSIRFDNMEAEVLLDVHALYGYLENHLAPRRRTYIFLDEIQLVPEFQKAVLSLFEHRDVDIYLTGSNAMLLSGELATLLSGRYIEIQILPLSFAEYWSFRQGEREDAWQEYFRYGGFPYLSYIKDETVRQDYLTGLYNTILLKDVVARRNVQNVMRLEDMVRFLMDSIGSLVSAKKIADTLTSSGRKTTAATVEQDLAALRDAYILYPCGRYDVQGKQHLKSLQKYYVVDLGLRRLLLGEKSRDLGHTLENVVYLELLRRGYRVNVGKIGTREIDFVAEKDGQKSYYQVAATVLDLDVFQREIRPLQEIRDNYPKHILTLDTMPIGEGGIDQKNILDWLTER